MRTYNINKTYIDEYDQISVVLMSTSFAIHLTANRLKYYVLGQLVLGYDTILLIIYMFDKELISQQSKRKWINI